MGLKDSADLCLTDYVHAPCSSHSNLSLTVTAPPTRESPKKFDWHAISSVC